MKSLATFGLLLAACQAGGLDKPTKPLDPQDAGSILEHVAFNTRSQPSYEAKFKARLLAPNSAPMDYSGTCVWVSPGVLYVHYTASGGDDKKIVRAGSKNAWVYNALLNDWFTDEESAMPGAGRGIQNPDEILAVVAKIPVGAKLLKPGQVEVVLTGDDIEKIMKEQASKDSFVWKQSNARMELAADGDTRLQKFSCDATLQSANAQVQGKVRYTAEVELVGFNGAKDLKFLDEKDRPIPLRPEMKAKIESVLKEKR